MSLNQVFDNGVVKPWLNVRVENIYVDGYSIPVSGATGLTGGASSHSQGGHQYNLSGFTGGATLTLGSVSPDGQVLSFIVDQAMAGAGTISAGSGIISGNILGNTGASKHYASASNIVVGTTAGVGDYFELRSGNGVWCVHGVVQLASAYT